MRPAKPDTSALCARGAPRGRETEQEARPSGPGSRLDVAARPEPACGHGGLDLTRLPELLRVPDLAAALGLSATAVRDLLARGDLPASKLGRQWVVRRDALLAQLADQERRRQPRADVDAVLASVRRPQSARDLARHARAAR